jgi:tankyrase
MTTVYFTQIERVWNTKLYKRYTLHKLLIQEENNNDANEKRLFHGSPKCEEIVQKGFDERHASMSGMFGAGIAWKYIIKMGRG